MANKATTKLDSLSNNNLYIVLALVSLLVLGVTGFATKAFVKSLITNGKVLNAQGEAKDKLTGDLSAAPQLISEFNNLGPKATTIADALPNAADFANLLVILQNMGGSTGVTIQSAAPMTFSTSGGTTTNTTTTTTTTTTSSAPAITPPERQEFNVSITVAGSYDNLQKFLTALEKSARPMRISDAQFSGNGSQVTAQLSVTTYYQAKATLPFSTETIK